MGRRPLPWDQGFELPIRYDPNRARYKHVARFGSTTETTLYMGALYERKQVGAAIEHVHYVRDGNDTVAVVRRTQGSTANAVKYLHRDHLGSVVAATDPNRAVLERMAYDAWGKRRADSSWSTPPAGSFINRSTTTHGPIPAERRAYTGHEQLDTVGLVHMNARIYDPELGRFLSADPTVQFPESTQGFNRYTYTGNNPLTYYDPSGFSFWKKAMRVVGVALNFIPGVGQFAAAAWWKAMIVGGVTGFLSSGGNLRAGLIGAIGGGLFNGIGGQFAGSLRASQIFQKALLHGVVGGALSAAAGGRFGEGALGGFFGAFASGHLQNSEGFVKWAGRAGDGDALGLIRRTVTSAVVGGVAASVGGGRFLWGAATASFANLFNQELSNRGRANYDQHREAVKLEVAKLKEEGFEILGIETQAKTDSLDYWRVYDVVARNPETSEIFGVEVKSSRVGAFRLDPRQVAFDVATVQSGAIARGLNVEITGVMYRGQCFGCGPGVAWKTYSLIQALKAANIPFSYQTSPKP